MSRSQSIRHVHSGEFFVLEICCHFALIARQNQRCRVDDAANYKKLYVEVQRDLTLEKTIALLQ